MKRRGAGGGVGEIGGSPGPDFCPGAPGELAWDSCSDTSVAWKAEASPGRGRHQVDRRFMMMLSKSSVYLEIFKKTQRHQMVNEQDPYCSM